MSLDYLDETVNLLGEYTNGNYKVRLYDDGTKIRWNGEDNFSPQFPESIDLNISNRCNQGCPFCYVNATPDGAIANLYHPILNSLHPYTELALNGNGMFDEGVLPYFTSFLKRMRTQGIVCNLTMHVDQFVKEYDTIYNLQADNLLHGIGISVNTPLDKYAARLIKKTPHAVIHIIAGIVSPYDILKMASTNAALLILGYKVCGRGKNYRDAHAGLLQNIATVEDSFSDFMRDFRLVSFDNLAIKQLHVRDHVSEAVWNTYYMGDDGNYTMYIDLVNEKYAPSSLDEGKPLFSNNIDEVFAEVRNGNSN